jgi:hypothetical protein
MYICDLTIDLSYVRHSTLYQQIVFMSYLNAYLNYMESKGLIEIVKNHLNCIFDEIPSHKALVMDSFTSSNAVIRINKYRVPSLSDYKPASILS